ncbi:MAG TPA: hypothetical protein VEK07_04785 [Polyangiaceae bacterium]|nr:hypothetical protein [Polyangiaceae bacterium]
MGTTVTDVDRLRAPPLLLFGLTSLAMHLATLGLLRRSGPAEGLSFEGTSPGLSGDTLEVDPTPLGSPGPLPEGIPTSPPIAETAIERAPGAPTPTRAGAMASPTAGAARPALFGAAGTRYATDLATTLTRAFPQAASADPVWTQVPFGPAGTADLLIVLDDDGHIADTSIGGAPSTALRRGIERTLSLLMLRPFTAHAQGTRLRITARVSRDDVHDGLHGDVFALSGGSFSGDLGSAFFALPPRDGAAGRRVDIDLRLVP